jgi:predicted O-linked N-acetylglucosamine transferase (SPINDLY family)
VTENQSDYEAQAVKLAGDTALLKTLRDRLKQNRGSCELFDTDLFRRRIEAAYEQMWQCWLAGEAPQAIAVKAD